MNPSLQYIINALAGYVGRLVLNQNDEKEQGRILAELRHFVNQLNAPGTRKLVYDPEDDDEL